MPGKHCFCSYNAPVSEWGQIVKDYTLYNLYITDEPRSIFKISVNNINFVNDCLFISEIQEVEAVTTVTTVTAVATGNHELRIRNYE